MQPNDDLVDTIISMGFSRDDAVQALKLHDNDVERAVNFLLAASEKDQHQHQSQLERVSEQQHQTSPDGGGNDSGGMMNALLSAISSINISQMFSYKMVLLVRSDLNMGKGMYAKKHALY